MRLYKKGLYLQWRRTQSRSKDKGPCKNCECSSHQTTSIKDKIQRELLREESMKKALEDVENGLSLKKARQLYNILELSIQAWKSGAVKSKHKGPPIVFLNDEEIILVKWCEVRHSVAHCASLNILKGKVKQMCAGKKTPFTNGTPRRKWWRWFQTCHPKLVLRKLELLDSKKARNLSKEACDTFYQFLGELFEPGEYPPSKIWNADETSLSAS